jgi:hypothetical protein
VRARDCVSVALAWRSHEGTGQRRRAEGSRRNMREQRGVVATASHWAERAVPSSPLSLSLSDDGRGVTEAMEGFPAKVTRERGSD